MSKLPDGWNGMSPEEKSEFSWGELQTGLREGLTRAHKMVRDAMYGNMVRQNGMLREQEGSLVPIRGIARIIRGRPESTQAPLEDVLDGEEFDSRPRLASSLRDNARRERLLADPERVEQLRGTPGGDALLQRLGINPDQKTHNEMGLQLARGGRNAIETVGREAGRGLREGLRKGLPEFFSARGKAEIIRAEGEKEERIINAQTRRESEKVLAPARAEVIREIPNLPKVARFSREEISDFVDDVARRTERLLGEAREQAARTLGIQREIARTPVGTRTVETKVTETYRVGRLRGGQSALESRSIATIEETPNLPRHTHARLPTVRLPAGEIHIRPATIAVGTDAYGEIDVRGNVRTGDFNITVSAGAGGWDGAAGAAADIVIPGDGGEYSGGGLEVDFY